MKRSREDVGGARLYRRCLVFRGLRIENVYDRDRRVRIGIGEISPPVPAARFAHQIGVDNQQVGHAEITCVRDQPDQVVGHFDLGIVHLLDDDAQAVGIVIEHQDALSPWQFPRRVGRLVTDQ